MHCFPNPAPAELLYPEAITTWPSGPTGLFLLIQSVRQACKPDGRDSIIE